MKTKNVFRKVSHLAGCIIHPDRLHQYHLCSYCEDAKDRNLLSGEALYMSRLNSKNEELKSIIRNSINGDNLENDT